RRCRDRRRPPQRLSRRDGGAARPAGGRGTRRRGAQRQARGHGAVVAPGLGRARGLRQMGRGRRRPGSAARPRRPRRRRVSDQAEMNRLAALVFAGVAAAAGPAVAQSSLVAALYEAAEIDGMRPRYEKGWLGNYERVFVPAFTAEERARLANVRFRFASSDPANEPFAFHSEPAGLVFVSATSLNLNGYTEQSLADYALMLRYWHLGSNGAAPPKPLDALCIPGNALADARVDERANRIFDDIVVFILLHELGHVRWGHP